MRYLLLVLSFACLAPSPQEPIYRRCEVRTPCSKVYMLCGGIGPQSCYKCDGAGNHFRCDGPTIENTCDPSVDPKGCGKLWFASCDGNQCVNWAQGDADCDRDHCFQ
jgi:hypothetical protein